NIRVQDGKVYINGRALDESKYLQGIATAGTVEVQLSDDEYFVLGDNRNASSDSRKWGEVDKKLIIGRAWLRAWPFDRLGALNK
ncbi:MAG: signal peptidase I, partial [Candidatus Portnoybacteria bacterium]|nr:signal peptidase I [Candidatus Portnoybacteria bacterium]